MRVRIIRQTAGTVNGVALNYYRQGQTYDIHSSLAGFLVLQGLAAFEMRRQQRSRRFRANDRRRR